MLLAVQAGLEILQAPPHHKVIMVATLRQEAIRLVAVVEGQQTQEQMEQQTQVETGVTELHHLFLVHLLLMQVVAVEVQGQTLELLQQELEALVVVEMAQITTLLGRLDQQI
jgi:isoprenylcysteine carboxyl methyltransferase (ICMT) family protein YpbQ